MTSASTTVLTASDIRSLLRDPGNVLDLLEAGFTSATSQDAWPLRVRTALPGPGTATTLLPGLLPGVPAYTVKVNAKFPAARPALRGVVCLHSLEDGRLLALLDSASVTAWRTGLAAALVTHRLARRSADRLAVIGAGAQARLVLRGLAHLRPLRQVLVHDLDAATARDFATWARDDVGILCTVALTPTEAVNGGDVVVSATWSTAPIIERSIVRPGQHLTSLGADEPGKRELAADLLSSALLVVDDIALAQEMGAVGNSSLDAGTVDATAAQVLTGAHPGRTSEDQVSLYCPVGLPWQDLALSWYLYNLAATCGLGRQLDLLA